MTIEDLSSQIVKQNMKYMKTPDNDEWKILIMGELLQTRCSAVDLSNQEKNEIDEMIRIIST